MGLIGSRSLGVPVMFIAAMLVSAQDKADPVSPCTFHVSSGRPTAEIVAASELGERAQVMAQPDSPIAIVRVDLSGLKFIGGAGVFESSGHHVVEVKNVTDQMITQAEVMVRVGFGWESGVGSGHGLKAPLKPGEHARVEWTSGTGRGTRPTSDEATIVILVALVTTASCVYKPSQAWPASVARP